MTKRNKPATRPTSMLWLLAATFNSFYVQRWYWLSSCDQQESISRVSIVDDLAPFKPIDMICIHMSTSTLSYRINQSLRAINSAVDERGGTVKLLTWWNEWSIEVHVRVLANVAANWTLQAITNLYLEQLCYFNDLCYLCNISATTCANLEEIHSPQIIKFNITYDIRAIFENLTCLGVRIRACCTLSYIAYVENSHSQFGTTWERLFSQLFQKLIYPHI